MISNSYSAGSVSGSDGGGLLQDAYEVEKASISDSYSTGAVINGGGGFICDSGGRRCVLRKLGAEFEQIESDKPFDPPSPRLR
jgi:hypothetical protein